MQKTYTAMYYGDYYTYTTVSEISAGKIIHNNGKSHRETLDPSRSKYHAQTDIDDIGSVRSCSKFNTEPVRKVTIRSTGVLTSPAWWTYYN